MKILHAPDLHCYYDNYGHIGPDGEHSRLTDWRRTADALLKAAIDNGVQLAVFPGDLFKNSRPAPAAIMAVAELFRRLEERDIRAIACSGNHDLVAPGQPGPVDLLATLGGNWGWGITAPKVIHVGRLDIAVLPSVKPAVLIDQTADPAELAALISQRLVEIVRGLAAQCTAEHRVLIGHWTIQGSISSSGQVMGIGVEPALPLSELIGLGFGAVLMGHIHKPQVLSEKPFVAYAGALERTDFGEENDARGCYIVDTDTGAYEWIDLPARRFLTIDLYDEQPHDDTAIRYLADGGAPEVMLSDLRLPIKDAVVRVVYRATEEDAKRIDAAAVCRALTEAGAYHIAGVYPEIIRTDRTREDTITERTGPVEALERWLTLKPDLTPERREAVLAEASRIMQEVAN